MRETVEGLDQCQSRYRSEEVPDGRPDRCRESPGPPQHQHRLRCRESRLTRFHPSRQRPSVPATAPAPRPLPAAHASTSPSPAGPTGWVEARAGLAAESGDGNLIMISNSIVVGFDDSATSRAAHRWAAAYAHTTGKDLRVVHVLDWPIGLNLSSVKSGARLYLPRQDIAGPYWRGIHRVFDEASSHDGAGTSVPPRRRRRCLGAPQREC
jgi:hypothetical protein